MACGGAPYFGWMWEICSRAPADRAVAQFEDKFKEWFRPVPTTASIFRHLSESPAFREFRTGDLSSSGFSTVYSSGDRLKAALQFLFY